MVEHIIGFVVLIIVVAGLFGVVALLGAGPSH